MTKFLNKNINIDLEELCDGLVPNSRGEYCVECPVCLKEFSEHKFKLYIKSNFSVGYCFHCHCKFFNTADKEKDLSTIVTPKFDYNSSNLFELCKIDVSYYENSKLEDLEGYSYLIKRNPDIAKILKYLDFRYRKNKIVMPFKWNNEVFYYQIRSTLNRDEAPLPYFCPPIDYKPIWVNPLNTKKAEVILTEGIFGAIAAWLKYKGTRDTIALQGSYLTKYQLWMLDSMIYSKYYMYFDDDKINFGLKNILYEHDPFLYNNIDTIHSQFGDPEDDYLGKSIVH